LAVDFFDQAENLPYSSLVLGGGIKTGGVGSMLFFLETNCYSMLDVLYRHPDAIFSTKGREGRRYYAAAILPSAASVAQMDFNQIAVQVLPRKLESLFGILKKFAPFEWRRNGRVIELSAPASQRNWWEKRLKPIRALLKRRIDFVEAAICVDREHQSLVKNATYMDSDWLKKHCITYNNGFGIHFGYVAPWVLEKPVFLKTEVA
jgi:hypothetical protein